MYAMKKLLFTLFSALIALHAAAQTFTYKYKDVELRYSVLNSNSCSVATSQSTTLTSAPIPATVTYNGTSYTVTRIDERAFENCTNLTTVVMPNSVSYVGAYAFYKCSALNSVTLSNAISAINGVTFNGCKNLTSIVIPPSVTKILGGAFDQSGLKKLYMGPNITSIGEYVFRGAPLTDIYITAQSAPNINATAFSAYSANVHVQGETAKANFSKATNWSNFADNDKIVIMDAVPTKLETYNDFNIASTSPLSANAGETATSNMFLAPGKSTTFSSTVSPTSGLDSRKVFWTSDAPDKVYVDTNGVVTCNALLDSEVTLTATTFYYKSPVLTIKCLPGYAVSSESNSKMYFIITDEDHKTCRLAACEEANATTLTIPSSVNLNGTAYTVTEIGPSALARQTILTNVTIPTTITKIQNLAFENSTALKSIIIPNSVTQIGAYAFRGCTSLSSVTLSNSITAIYGVTFYGCTNLKSIIIPPAVKMIHGGAFHNSGLEKVYLGPNITNINEYVFHNTPLTDIYITTQKAPTITSTTFSAYTAKVHVQGESAETNYRTTNNWSQFNDKIAAMNATITQMSVYNDAHYTSSQALTAKAGETAMGELFMATGQTTTFTTSYSPTAIDAKYIFWTSSAPDKVFVDQNGKVTFLALPATDVTLTGISLYYNTPIIKMTVKAGYEYTASGGPKMYYTIVDNTLKTCRVAACENSGTVNINIPSTAIINNGNYTVTQIGACAFSNLTATKTVAIPNTVTSIGTSAFAGSVELESITVPNSVNTLGSYAFRGCTSLSSVTLSNSITAIYGVTFYGCTNLKSIVIPPSVTAINGGAFHNSGLEKIYMGPKIAFIGEYVFSNAPLTDIYITAQSAPTTRTEPSTFSAYTAKLHLQGENAKTNFSIAPNWINFTNIDVLNNIPHRIVVSKGTGSSAPLHALGKVPESPYNTETHIFGQPGDTFQRSATPLRDDNKPVDIPYIFWKSSDRSKVYVDNNGEITINTYPDIGKPVTVTAQSLYANTPTQEIFVDNYTMTNVEDIEIEPEADYTESETRIYTIGGVYVGNSLRGILPGIYIVVQGKKTVKITVR